MDSTDAADLIAEIHEDRAENQAAESFRNRAALMIAILAALLAVGGLGGGNATDDMIENNIKASDTWAFYQAKNVRQTLYKSRGREAEGLARGRRHPWPPSARRRGPAQDYEANVIRLRQRARSERSVRAKARRSFPRRPRAMRRPSSRRRNAT